jgi:hypothetical protein
VRNVINFVRKPVTGLRMLNICKEAEVWLLLFLLTDAGHV